MNKYIAHIKNRHHGFTLIELIFAITLLSVMLIICITAFIGVLRFSVWSRTTRTNQAAARETLDSLTRLIEANDIVSVSTNSICLKKPLENESYLITVSSINPGLPGSPIAIVKLTFSTANCSGSFVEAIAISNTTLYVQSLKFSSKIVGAVGSDSYLATHPQSVDSSTSIIIDMIIVNGNATNPGGVWQCSPSDNFCDVAKFTTAVSGN